MSRPFFLSPRSRSVRANRCDLGYAARALRSPGSWGVPGLDGVESLQLVRQPVLRALHTGSLVTLFPGLLGLFPGLLGLFTGLLGLGLGATIPCGWKSRLLGRVRLEHLGIGLILQRT